MFINLFAHVNFRMEALEVGLTVHTATEGKTVIDIPPVGEVMAHTHRSPLLLKLSLNSIDLDRLKAMLNQQTSQDTLMQEAQKLVMEQMKKFVAITLALSFFGGAFGVLVFQRKKAKEILAGGLIGLFTVALLLSLTYKTFDIQKFRNPEYEGAIKAAPWMISLVQDGITTVNTWGKEMRLIATNLYGLFQRVETLKEVSTSESEIKVLHVTDIHNNPASFDFIDQVVKTFGVDVVVDSGDISDFGTPLETALLERIKKVKVPYVFVPGNHETQGIITELKKIPNVTVVEGGVINMKGLNIAAIEDPSALSQDYHSPKPDEITAYRDKLQKIIDQSKVEPDIVVAHNPKIAGNFWGKYPLVLCGHDHQYKIKVKPDSVMIDAGTSGAAGIGALRTKKEIPYSFVLLHFGNAEGKIQLKYTDTINISNQQSGYSLERKVYPELHAGTRT